MILVLMKMVVVQS